MSIISTAMIFGGLLLMIVSLFMTIRNFVVYSYRMKAIDDDLERFHRLPSYDRMIWQVWKFNWDDVK